MFWALQSPGVFIALCHGASSDQQYLGRANAFKLSRIFERRRNENLGQFCWYKEAPILSASDWKLE